MSKISNAVKMLYLLNDRQGYFKIHDLATELEVDARQVRRYFDDLLMAGFDIESHTGKDGGYRLVQKFDHKIPFGRFEALALNLCIQNNKLVKETLNKSLSSIDQLNENLVLGTREIPESMLTRLVKIQMSINARKKIRFDYRSASLEEMTLTTNPYFIRIYQERYYLLADYQGTIRTYRIERIDSLEMLDEIFPIDRAMFDKEKQNNVNGIGRSDTTYDVHFMVDSHLEKVLDTYFDQAPLKINASAKGAEYTIQTQLLSEVLHTFLAMGKGVRIIRPKILLDLYRKEVTAMYENTEKQE